MIMKINLILLLTICCFSSISAQEKLKTENVFLFAGADSALMMTKEYTHDPEQIEERFWHEDPVVRREKLMPFFWSEIEMEGQLLGNREYGNNVDLTNSYWFSYPGYNEILTGYSDPEINSNGKKYNQNVTVLEYINQQKEFKGKVAAFGSWDVFPYIINEERSGVPVNAGFESAKGGNLSEREIFLNELQTEIPSPWDGVRLDAFTHHYALEYIKKEKPRMVYIAYGETDDFAHDGRYDFYLKSAHQTDAFIKELWDYVQSDAQYKDKTTFVIATDHGRGTVPLDSWKHHGEKIKGADQVWFAVLGPDTIAKGEVKTKGNYYQNQIASTVAGLLGLDYKSKTKGVKAVAEMYTTKK
jgi:predicted AlkP superfamily pyrophosphatase or phosphodiesterase